MEHSLKLAPGELNANLLEALKKYIVGINATELTISFTTPNAPRLRKETQGETNERIDTAVKYFEDGNSGIEFSFDEFKELEKVLLKMK